MGLSTRHAPKAPRRTFKLSDPYRARGLRADAYFLVLLGLPSLSVGVVLLLEQSCGLGCGILSLCRGAYTGGADPPKVVASGSLAAPQPRSDPFVRVVVFAFCFPCRRDYFCASSRSSVTFEKRLATAKRPAFPLAQDGARSDVVPMSRVRLLRPCLGRVAGGEGGHHVVHRQVVRGVTALTVNCFSAPIGDALRRLLTKVE